MPRPLRTTQRGRPPRAPLAALLAALALLPAAACRAPGGEARHTSVEAPTRQPADAPRLVAPRPDSARDGAADSTADDPFAQQIAQKRYV
ncbi:MAG TPA: hypothetical protein VFS05_15535, partial [Gemmatimonadaceae bacterium]|nr:hypothetical protein [Gemmatimonadaceae bacterium]